MMKLVAEQFGDGGAWYDDAQGLRDREIALMTKTRAGVVALQLYCGGRELCKLLGDGIYASLTIFTTA